MKHGISTLINPYYVRFNDGIMAVIGAVIGGFIYGVYGSVLGAIAGFLLYVYVSLALYRRAWELNYEDAYNILYQYSVLELDVIPVSEKFTFRLGKHKFCVEKNRKLKSEYGIVSDNFLYITLNQFLWGKIEDDDIFQKFLQKYSESKIEDWKPSMFRLCIIIKEDNVQACFDFLECFIKYEKRPISDLTISGFITNSISYCVSDEEFEKTPCGLSSFNFYGRLLDSPIYMHKGKFFILWKGQNLHFKEFPKWWKGEELDWKEILDKRLAETQNEISSID